MENKVQMAPRQVLLSIAFIEALAEAVRSLGLTRRPMVEWLAAVLTSWVAAGGVILNWNGDPIYLHDDLMEVAHGDDPSVTCMSDLMAIYPGTRQRRPRHTMLLRLGLYDAAFKIIGRPIVVDD